jgi:hypothetical protein
MWVRKEIQAVLWKNYTPLKLLQSIVTQRSVCGGQVNNFNLAKNTGTSVDQIERFDARNLPPSRGMAINLQSFGGDQ